MDAHRERRRPWRFAPSAGRSARTLAGLFLLSVPALLAFVPGPSPAQDPQEPAGQELRAPRQPVSDAVCRMCHGDVETPHAMGEAAGGAVHAGVSCVGCHDALADFDLEEMEHEQPPPPASCAGCHAEVQARFDSSVHGEQELTCAQCHGSHQVRSVHAAGAPLAVVHGNTLCTGCHAEAAAAYERGVHATELAGGVPAASCQDCHGAHDVQGAADPRSRVFPLRLPDTCESCHRPEPPPEHPAPAGERVRQYESSAHGIALRRDGLVVTATCRSCHGSHEILPVQDPAAPTSRGKVPYTCGACHAGILQGYLAGVHGTEFEEGGAAVPVCTDCHGEHTISGPDDPVSSVAPERVAQTCARCHADEDLMERHEIAPARIASWGRSYHGIASALGEAGAANCASCHGFHGIFPSTDPRSRIHPANLERTCGGCHTGYGAAFARVPVHSVLERGTNPIPWMVGKVYVVLIAATIGAFALFVLIDLFGRLRIRMGWGPPETEHVVSVHWPDEDRLVAPAETFPRMSRPARAQHGLLIASFTLLVLTGLPLFLHRLPIMRSLVGLEGGFRLRSDLHRIAATALIGLSLWHVASLVVDPRARRWARGMLIRRRDVADFAREVLFSLGLADWLARRRPFRAFFERHPALRFARRPALGRYGLVEKLEYGAVVWGNLVMIATGFVLWRPDWFLARLPVWVFEVCRVTHGYEATLAFLAIIVWHMYHVHMRPGVFPMSRVWLDGRISREALKHHHPAEYVKLLEQRRRRRNAGSDPGPGA
jgi:cytochrome b subunit of formate dehydrogenase